MNICEAIQEAYKSNCAVRRSDWPLGTYVYQGMDNIIMIHNSENTENIDSKIVPCGALFLGNKWELDYQHTYHGPLQEKIYEYDRLRKEKI